MHLFYSTFLTNVIIGIILLSLTACSAEEEVITPSTPQLSDELQTVLPIVNEHSHELVMPPLELSDEDLQPLDKLGDATIVGLGEATHGTKEFFEMKHRIFQYLVEQHGFKVFAFEADYAESLYFDDYVTGKSNIEITTLMKDKMLFWTWRTKEVSDLLKWMRSYNAGKPASEMVRYLGVDCQFTNYYREQLVQRMEPLNSVLSDSIGVILQEYPNLEQGAANNYTDEQWSAIELEIEQVKLILEDNATTLISASSELEYAYLKQLATVMEQVYLNIYSLVRQSGTYARDPFMANNTLWASDIFGGAKVVAWAHNLHIAKELSFGRTGAQGYLLSKEIGEQYRNIGFSFANGTLTAAGIRTGFSRNKFVNQYPKLNSITQLLHEASGDNYMLVLDDIRQTELGAWLNEERLMLNIGAAYDNNSTAYYVPYNLLEVFDVMIHFDETSASQYP